MYLKNGIFETIQAKKGNRKPIIHQKYEVGCCGGWDWDWEWDSKEIQITGGGTSKIKFFVVEVVFLQVKKKIKLTPISQGGKKGKDEDLLYGQIQ